MNGNSRTSVNWHRHFADILLSGDASEIDAEGPKGDQGDVGPTGPKGVRQLWRWAPVNPGEARAPVTVVTDGGVNPTIGFKRMKGIDMSTAKFRRAAAVLASAALAATLTVTASADASQQSELAKVRAATAKYHDIQVAEAAGYQLASPCVVDEELPFDGVMGYHYVHFGLFGAPLDPAKPAALLYLPDKQGKLHLAGVEYFKVDEDQDLSTDGDRPSLFGVPFAGPMEGHGPGMPIHYDLHVWVWKHNPSGMFTEWNPAGSCD